MNKKAKWGLVALILVSLAAWGIYSSLPKENKELSAADKISKGKTNKNILNVNAIVVKPQTLSDEIYINGSLLPDEEVNLSFETSGKITEINFKEGTFVKKGDLLAKVNDRTLQAQLQRLTSQVKLAEDRVYRQSTLLKRDAVSQEAYEQVKTDLATLKAEIEMVEANIALTELRAPFDGVIGLRGVSVGTYASPSIVVAKLTKISPIKVEFAVPEHYADDVQIGYNVEFTLPGELGKFHAKVYAKESMIDPTTHTLTVRALYDNSKGAALAGRYASVNLEKQRIENAITVPSESIVPEMGVDKLYLYKSGKAMPATVQVGIRTDKDVQITSGLNPGDTVIVSGTLQLRMGLPVVLDNVE
ncbi:MAG: efflux RND transporter periplasmic adaptor subunit [Bacteroidales bacterium]|nr:efflux RND transporter periplasmic adaptor subunit [Bacteroidales bacterium]